MQFQEQSDLRFYDIQELVALLKIDRKTALKYIHEGRLKAVKIGRKWTVSEANLKMFINGSVTA